MPATGKSVSSKKSRHQILIQIVAHVSPRLSRYSETRDGQSLDLESGSFDAVFSSFGIFLFPDRMAGWREAANVLRPAGLFVTSIWRGPEFNERARAQMQPLMEALPKRLTDPSPRPGWANLMEPATLIEEVTRAAPLSDTEIHVLDATIVLPSPREMWRLMVGNPVTGALIGKCTPDEMEAVERDVMKALESRSGGPDKPIKLNASCHVLIARRF